MIRSFGNRLTERLFAREMVKWGTVALREKALLRLVQLNYAVRVEDMRLPPGNRLEQLRGDRKAQWSVRLNDQWRLCFVWRDGDAHDVEIVDYH